ncbi:uncharacterized protein, partial [Anabrus simplex]|uniref:uncharacterized protein n=1 Tax=Anabrus simplex TaxID=316456 RepID=UPI0035A27BC6
KSALWDLTADEYANRDLKRKNWEELRKWKPLRDCYYSERQRVSKMKSGAGVQGQSSSAVLPAESHDESNNMEEGASEGSSPDGE